MIRELLEVCIIFFVLIIIGFVNYSFAEEKKQVHNDSYVLYCEPNGSITIEFETKNIPCTNNSECYGDE